MGSPCLRKPVTCDLKGPSSVLLPAARAGKLLSFLYCSSVSRDFFSAETELFSCQITHDEKDLSSVLSSDPNSYPNTDGNTCCGNEQNPRPESPWFLAKDFCLGGRCLSLAVVFRLRLGFHGGLRSSLSISGLELAVMRFK